MKTHTHDSGFTLLEVLVALAILAAALAGIYQIYVSGFRSQTIARSRLQAVDIAENLLARVGADIPLAQGAVTGNENTGFAYRITMHRTKVLNADTATPTELFDVEVEVTSGPIQSGTAPVVLKSKRLLQTGR